MQSEKWMNSMLIFKIFKIIFLKKSKTSDHEIRSLEQFKIFVKILFLKIIIEMLKPKLSKEY